MVKLDEIHPNYITNAAGKKKSVVLPIAEFEALIEDLEDLAKIAERRDESNISHASLLAELKRDGLL